MRSRKSCLCLRRKPQENGLDVVTDGIELALESVNPYVDALEPLVYQVNPCVYDLHTSVVSHKYGYEDARAFWLSARRDDL